MKIKTGYFAFLLAAGVCLMLSCASNKPSVQPELLNGPGWTTENNNLHQIDGPPLSDGDTMAFRVYRSGSPSKETFAKWCRDYHIQHVIDMAGTATDNERAYQKAGICPNIEIIYSEKQDPATPVTKEFLKFFDEQVEQSKSENVGILFRCTTGSHRTGRLAAYYQMKYQDLEPDEAIKVMDHLGVAMAAFDAVLQPQVRALHDYVHGRPCSQPAQYCVK